MIIRNASKASLLTSQNAAGRRPAIAHDRQDPTTAFHPDFTMRDRPPTPPETLARARRIALDNGIRYAYTGNVHDPAGQSTRCHACGEVVIERYWYRLGAWRLTGDGQCRSCGTRIPGVFDGSPGTWGPRQLPVRLAPPGRSGQD